MTIPPNLDPQSLSWESAKHLRLIAILALVVMVITATDAHAYSIVDEGTPWGSVSVTLPIYLSSMLTAFGCGITFNRWTSRREREHKDLSREVAELKAMLLAQTPDNSHGKNSNGPA